MLPSAAHEKKSRRRSSLAPAPTFFGSRSSLVIGVGWPSAASAGGPDVGSSKTLPMGEDTSASIRHRAAQCEAKKASSSSNDTTPEASVSIRSITDASSPSLSFGQIRESAEVSDEMLAVRVSPTPEPSKASTASSGVRAGRKQALWSSASSASSSEGSDARLISCSSPPPTPPPAPPLPVPPATLPCGRRPSCCSSS